MQFKSVKFSSVSNLTAVSKTVTAISKKPRGDSSREDSSSAGGSSEKPIQRR